MKSNILKKTVLAGFLAVSLASAALIPLPTDGQVHAATQSSKSAKVEKVIALGQQYKGTPYKFGASRSSTKAFDCSSFVKHVFSKAAGVTLPGSSATQASYVKKKSTIKKSLSTLKRGDLVFFMSYKGSSKSSYSKVNKSAQKVTHVGIYLGNNKILHTYSQKSGGVRIDNMKGTHWEYRMLFGGSAL